MATAKGKSSGRTATAGTAKRKQTTGKVTAAANKGRENARSGTGDPSP
jgi:hypothetical protein